MTSNPTTSICVFSAIHNMMKCIENCPSEAEWFFIANAFCVELKKNSFTKFQVPIRKYFDNIAKNIHVSFAVREFENIELFKLDPDYIVVWNVESKFFFEDYVFIKQKYDVGTFSIYKLI